MTTEKEYKLCLAVAVGLLCFSVFSYWLFGA